MGRVTAGKLALCQTRRGLKQMDWFFDFVHKVQKVIPLNWVTVSIRCPSCNANVDWVLNDTEYLADGDLLNYCPRCYKEIRIYFKKTAN